MGRRYNFDDLNTAALPRISMGVWRFSDRVYTWRCSGRTSTGYGTTPADAYNAWLRNWRRFKWYGDRHNAALDLIRRTSAQRE